MFKEEFAMKPKILIIEDDPIDYEYLSEKIKAANKYDIIPETYSEMSAAFSRGIHDYVKEKIIENHNDLKLIICDLLFGKTREGQNLISDIRHNSDYRIKNCKYFTSLIPIIAFSNFPDAGDNAIDCGASLFFQKPTKSLSDNSIYNDDAYKHKNITIMENLITTIHRQIKLFENTRKNIEEKSTPRAIKDVVQDFKGCYENKMTAFIMTSYTEKHKDIIEKIKQTLSKHEIIGMLAKDGEWTDDLFHNTQVYMHCCNFGIGIFTKIDNNVEFNSNMTLEVGYMVALEKKVCYLKDNRIKNLPTDLKGKLYSNFDFSDLNTIETVLEDWLKTKRII